MTAVFVEFDRREAQAALAAVAAAGGRAAEVALDQAAEIVLSEAQAQSPVKTGFLQSSHVVIGTGRARAPAGSGQGLASAVDRLSDSARAERVIGVNAVYALAVHARHPTRARWFVEAVRANLARVLQAALRRAVRREGGADA